MTVLFGVLVASLLGSVHCAAMCGAFTCLYTTGPRAPRTPFTAHVSYNAGRLASYLMLGLAAGALGGRMDIVGDNAGFGHVAPVVAGALMILWAVGIFAAQMGMKVPVTLAPEWAKRALGTVVLASRESSANVRAMLIGLITTLLPCGWLYAFAVVAGGTGSAVRGAAVMAAFWVGTVPMLLLFGAGAARLLGPVARRLPLVSAGLVLTLGVLSVAGKLRPPALPSQYAHSHAGMGR